MLKCDLLIDSNDIKSTISKLKNEDDYSILLDVTVIDYLKFPDITPSRFAVVYILRNTSFKKQISVKAYINDNTLEVDSLTPFYDAANWAEREAYDQYGIKFKGHPNLKRVCTQVFLMVRCVPLSIMVLLNKKKRIYRNLFQVNGQVPCV